MHRRRHVNSGPSVLPQTAALVAAMSTPPTAARKSLIDATIRSLIVSGVWARCDAIYVLAAHNSQAARLNWKTPGTNTLTVINSPVFTTDRGYTGDAVSAALSATYAGSNYTQNDCSISCFGLTGPGGGNSFALTNSTPAQRAAVRVRSGTLGGVTLSSATSIFATTSTNTMPRMLTGTRTGAAGFDIYSNGAFADTIVAASAANPTPTTLWFLTNGVGTFSDHQVAFGATGASLSAAQNAALYQATFSYMRAVGAA